MDLRWIEDYVSLREAGSFTAAAERRNTSQPAFSRRIQSLEEWLGVQLVDRSQRPLTFTPMAIENDAEIRNLLRGLHDLRSRMRGEKNNSPRVKLAIQHSLAVSFLPKVFIDPRINESRQTYFVYGEDRDRCIDLMYRREVDFIIVYETDKFRTGIPESVATKRSLGFDSMVLAGSPLRNAPETKGMALPNLPLLTYPHSSFFGQVLWDHVLPSIASSLRIETICVSTFSSALNEMVQAGLGYAWLPKSLIAGEVTAGTIAIHEPERLACPLDLVLYSSTAPSDAQVSAWRDTFVDVASSIHL